jgi:hypothetical protein
MLGTVKRTAVTEPANCRASERQLACTRARAGRRYPWRGRDAGALTSGLSNQCCDDLPDLRLELGLAATGLRHKRHVLQGW